MGAHHARRPAREELEGRDIACSRGWEDVKEKGFEFLKFEVPGLRCRASWAAEGGELGSNSEKNGCDFRDEDTGGQIKNKELRWF